MLPAEERRRSSATRASKARESAGAWELNATCVPRISFGTGRNVASARACSKSSSSAALPSSLTGRSTAAVTPTTGATRVHRAHDLGEHEGDGVRREEQGTVGERPRVALRRRHGRAAGRSGRPKGRSRARRRPASRESAPSRPRLPHRKAIRHVSSASFVSGATKATSSSSAVEDSRPCRAPGGRGGP